MAKPKDGNVKEVRDWLVRHKFGGLSAASIKSSSTTIEDLEILKGFIDDVIEEKTIKTDKEDK